MTKVKWLHWLAICDLLIQTGVVVVMVLYPTDQLLTKAGPSVQTVFQLTLYINRLLK